MRRSLIARIREHPCPSRCTRRARRASSTRCSNLSAILDKAQAHGEAKKIDPAVLAPAAIADMFPLARQVQIACDTAKGAVARLAGVEIPKHEDTEQTLAELKARIAKTLDFVSRAGGEDRRHRGAEVLLKLRGQDVKFDGMQYLLGYACRTSTSTS